MNISYSKNIICDICGENYKGGGKYKQVDCGFCGNGACRSCWEMYSLSHTGDVKCMFPSCSRKWGYEMIGSAFTAAFVTSKLRNHLTNVYYSREKTLFAGTQPIVDRIVWDKKWNDAIDKYYKMTKEFELEFHTEVNYMKERYTKRWKLEGKTIIPSNEKEWRLVRKLKHNNDWYDKNFKEEYKLADRVKSEKINRAYENYWKPVSERLRADKPNRKNKVSTVVNCSHENCNGFLNNKWYCGLCDTSTCSECRKNINNNDEEHTCNPDDVATAKMILKESKPCPGCNISIMKTEGCDQMWCTSCNTGWDWKTGRIERKIHNPHYFEYLRKLDSGVVDRNPMEVRCGREIDETFSTSLNFILRKLGASDQFQIFINQICVSIMNFQIDVLEGAYGHLGEEPDTEILRINFMTNKISEDEFKSKVYLKHKNFHKHRSIRDILVMFIQSSTDILYRYRNVLDYSNNREDASRDKTLNELVHLLLYANKCFKDTSNVYKSKPLELEFKNNGEIIFI